MFIVGIICTILIFTLVVLVHEWGHFSVARFFGVKVEEFGLGLPPRAKKIMVDKKGTLYSLNWFPLGGFVRLKGESELSVAVYSGNGKKLSLYQIEKKLQSKELLLNSDKIPLSLNEKQALKELLQENASTDNFHKKAYWKQSLVILAGVVMNFFLAWVLFTFLFFIGTKPVGILTLPEISSDSLLVPTYEQALTSGVLIKKEGIYVHPIVGSSAEKYGLKLGDLILQVNHRTVSAVADFKDILLSEKGQKINFQVSRSGSIFPLDIQISDDGKIGAYISENIDYNKNFEYKMSLGGALISGGKEVYEQSSLALKGLKFVLSKILFPQKVGDRSEAIESMSGPIGITEVVTQGLSQGVPYLIAIAALISVNLAVFNLLPIPALDGGRFLFICLHASFRLLGKNKFISTYFENIIHVFFFMLLIVISLLIAYNDIIKLFHS